MCGLAVGPELTSWLTAAGEEELSQAFTHLKPQFAILIADTHVRGGELSQAFTHLEPQFADTQVRVGGVWCLQWACPDTELRVWTQLEL